MNKEEVVWIYESPDKGKTVYRRPFGKSGPRELMVFNKPIILN
jgi:hypothetical protein